MEIVNYQLLDGETVIADLPRLPYDATVRAWVTESGYIIATDNEIPEPSWGDEVFRADFPADPVEQQKLQHERLIARLTDVVQSHLDSVARSKGYDGILSAASYAASLHPIFQAEGLAAVAWRDQVWSTCYDVLADVQSGKRIVPDEAQLLAELPTINW